MLHPKSLIKSAKTVSGRVLFDLWTGEMNLQNVSSVNENAELSYSSQAARVNFKTKLNPSYKLFRVSIPLLSI